MLDKNKLRKELLRKRNELNLKLRHSESDKIKDTLILMPEYKTAKTIFIYVSYGSEVETQKLLEIMLKDKKQICVPLCDVDTHTMQAVKINDMSLLKKGAYGILEPDITSGVFAPDEIDLAIVPAISFDKRGMRLGYGAGYYDRFLADFKGVSIGLAFSELIYEELPVCEFDKPVDKIITGRELITCGN